MADQYKCNDDRKLQHYIYLLIIFIIHYCSSAAGCCVPLFVYVSAAQCQVGDSYSYCRAFASWLLHHEVHGK